MPQALGDFPMAAHTPETWAEAQEPATAARFRRAAALKATASAGVSARNKPSQLKGQQRNWASS